MSERIKFYLDEPVNPAVASGLRRRGIDVLTAQEAGLPDASDAEHLVMAAAQQRVILTQADDFLRLHARQIDHAGLVYMRQRTSIGYIVRGLLLIYQTLQPDEMKNRLEFL